MIRLYWRKIIHVIGPIYSVIASFDSRFIISGSDDKSIKMFDVETHKEIAHFKDVHEGI